MPKVRDAQPLSAVDEDTLAKLGREWAAEARRVAKDDDDEVREWVRKRKRDAGADSSGGSSCDDGDSSGCDAGD